ncbi:MAG: hypothetical protein IKO93_13880 [Lentisphaeria bacterium]|nr:hypothetical protein [Lentisphaeria bacterium]
MASLERDQNFPVLMTAYLKLSTVFFPFRNGIFTDDFPNLKISFCQPDVHTCSFLIAGHCSLPIIFQTGFSHNTAADTAEYRSIRNPYGDPAWKNADGIYHKSGRNQQYVYEKCDSFSRFEYDFFV